MVGSWEDYMRGSQNKMKTYAKFPPGSPRARVVEDASKDNGICSQPSEIAFQEHKTGMLSGGTTECVRPGS